MAAGLSAEDRWALRDLSAEYARLIDQRSFDEVGQLFTEHGVLATARGERIGRQQIVEAMTGLLRWEATFHLVGQTSFTAASGSDTSAQGEVACIAHHWSDSTSDKTRVDHQMYIRYQDRYAKTADGWRFANRTLHVARTMDVPAD